MTYRDAGLAPAPVRPPQLFGFALYLIGIGCALMGVAQVVLLAVLHSWLPVSANVVMRTGMPISEVMIGLGLVVALRKTDGGRQRLMAIATMLWIMMSVLDFEQDRVRTSLGLTSIRALLTPTAMTYAGWAIALGLLAIVVFAGGRSFAARTWPAALGMSLIVADAWEVAWPVIVPRAAESTIGFGGVVLFDALGLFVIAGGLFAAGRSILRAVTMEELRYAKSPRARKEADEPLPDDPDAPLLRRGLPLLVDASVAIAGIATCLPAALAGARLLERQPLQIIESSATGGALLSFALLALGLHRLGPLSQRAKQYAIGAFGTQLVIVILLGVTTVKGSHDFESLLPYFLVAPPVLAAGGVFAAATALALYEVKTVSASSAMLSLRGRLRSAGLLLATSALIALMAPQATSNMTYGLELAAFAIAAFSLYVTIRAANDARRIEIALSR